MKALLPFILSAVICQAAMVSATWDANPPQESVTNYILYFGTVPDSYPFRLDTGNTTNITVLVSDNTTYYFALRAQSADELSPMCEPVSLTIPDMLDAPSGLRVFPVIEMETDNSWTNTMALPPILLETPHSFGVLRVRLDIENL